MARRDCQGGGGRDGLGHGERHVSVSRDDGQRLKVGDGSSSSAVSVVGVAVLVVGRMGSLESNSRSYHTISSTAI